MPKDAVPENLLSGAEDSVAKAILAGVLDPLVIINDRGTVLTASDSLERIFGYAPAELIGRNVRLLMPEPHRSRHDGYLERYRQTGDTNILGRTREFEVVRKDGGRILCELSVSRVDAPGAAGPLFTGSFRDITEKRRAQEQEQRVLKTLAQLGESAAMLAHEIKTPITAVNLALRTVAKKLGEDDQEVLEDLVVRLARVERTIRQTLSFAKPIGLAMGDVESNSLLKRAIDLASREISKKDVRAEVEPSSRSIVFRGDLALLEEAVLNLVHNAVHALESGGRIRLSARVVDAGSFDLVVEDDGPGVPESIRDELFKPFFTTRKYGTGLGLAIVKRTVEEHGGTIRVGSSALGGALFAIRLPFPRDER
jgi:two-component system sensor kinase FixL